MNDFKHLARNASVSIAPSGERRPSGEADSVRHPWWAPYALFLLMLMMGIDLDHYPGDGHDSIVRESTEQIKVTTATDFHSEATAGPRAREAGSGAWRGVAADETDRRGRWAYSDGSNNAGSVEGRPSEAEQCITCEAIQRSSTNH